MDTTSQTRPGITASTSKKDFSIPQEVKDKYPDLIELILGSASMNDDERQYWFSILPIMTQDQVTRLREILTTEKQKLAEIDQKYQKQLDDVNQKHLIEWQAMKAKEQKQQLEQAEQKTKSADEKESEHLLDQLNNL
jgi:hypothetical protein